MFHTVQLFDIFCANEPYVSFIIRGTVVFWTNTKVKEEA